MNPRSSGLPFLNSSSWRHPRNGSSRPATATPGGLGARARRKNRAACPHGKVSHGAPCTRDDGNRPAEWGLAPGLCLGARGMPATGTRVRRLCCCQLGPARERRVSGPISGAPEVLRTNHPQEYPGNAPINSPRWEEKGEERRVRGQGKKAGT